MKTLKFLKVDNNQLYDLTMRITFKVSVLLASFVLYSGNLYASDEIELIPQPQAVSKVKKTKKVVQIQKISLDHAKLEKEEKNSSTASPHYVVTISGVYHRVTWALFVNDKKIQLTDSQPHQFSFEVALEKNDEPFTLKTVSPLGRVEVTEYRIHVKNGEALFSGKNTPEEVSPESVATSAPEVALEKETAPKKVEAYVGLSPTLSQFNNESISIHQTSLAIKAGLNRLIDRWVVGGRAYYNGVSLSRTPDTLPSARMYGADLHGGYRFEKQIFGFEPTLLLGWFYRNMTTTDSVYGLSKVLGPEISISAAHQLSSGKVFSFYFTYGQIAERPSLNLGHHEFSAGASFGFYKNWSAITDFSSFHTIYSGARPRSLNTGSVGVAYNW